MDFVSSRRIMYRCWLLGLGGKYGVIFFALVAENAGLRGHVEELEKSSACFTCATGLGVATPTTLVPPPVVTAARTVVTPMPVETWSTFVRSKNTADTLKEVVKKVVEQVGPTLDVRVHGVKPIRGDGAIVRTPSLAEREKIAANANFVEVVLGVSIVNKSDAIVLVQSVHEKLSAFMDKLHGMKLLRFIL